ncbi:MAG TPA: hypothetical protein DCE80_05940 [Ignavibacteriales bacterium]|nr:hypothetical protein [Ignavibacteriales bacterium]
MPKNFQVINRLKAYDFIVISFNIFLIILNLLFHNQIKNWQTFIVLNLLTIIFVFLLAYTAETYRYKILRIIHYLYLIPLVLLTFKEIYFLIRPLRPNDYDQLLINIDRWLFGVDPTVFLYKFSHPVITEILQIIYGMFYFLPIILGLVLLKKRRLIEADFAIFTIIFGFFLSYIGYFALPAIGPRFTLHDFQNENAELPGLLLTNFLREVTNTVESIPPGTLNPENIVQRDVFPSGHTMITLVVIYLSIKLKSRSRFFLIPAGTLLIFATVYLRYHYVIDLIGGLVFMHFCVFTSPLIFNWWSKRTNRYEFKL